MGQTQTSGSPARGAALGADPTGNHHRVLILGSGPAGLTAALYAARANLKPVVVSGNEPGGQLTITTEVENYPGYVKGVQGPDMMKDFRDQAERFGTAFLAGNAEKADLARRPFKITLEKGEVLSADALIVSTGASARWLGLPSETRLRNRGVSAWGPPRRLLLPSPPPLPPPRGGGGGAGG